VQEENDPKPLRCPSQVPKAHGAPLSPRPLLPPHSPAPLWLRRARQGHVPPGDPWEGEERSCRGVSCGPCPGLCPPGSTAGQSVGTKDHGPGVGSLCQPQPYRHLRAPGRTRSAPGRAPPTHGTSHGHQARCPRAAGHAHAQTQVTAASAPHAAAHGQDPRAAPMPRGCGKLSAGRRAAWGTQLLAPRPPPSARFRLQLQPGATRCLPILPGTGDTGDTGDSQEPAGSVPQAG